MFNKLPLVTLPTVNKNMLFIIKLFFKTDKINTHEIFSNSLLFEVKACSSICLCMFITLSACLQNKQVSVIKLPKIFIFKILFIQEPPSNHEKYKDI